MLSGAFWTPMEVLKTKLQVGGTSASPLKVLSRVMTTQGIFGLYRGYWLSLATFMPYTILYWQSYEYLKRKIYQYRFKTNMTNDPPLPNTMTMNMNSSKQVLPFQDYILAASISAMLAASSSNVIDVVKTRWQSSWESHQRSGISYIIKSIWKENGWRGFFRGVGARVLWATPAVAVSMTVYESAKDWREHHLRASK